MAQPAQHPPQVRAVHAAAGVVGDDQRLRRHAVRGHQRAEFRARGQGMTAVLAGARRGQFHGRLGAGGT
ncbi:hypothetical protein G6F50_017888 [Rhizopus delemar]|uniref:Uncharacterized protein n=1 Tax=Rhizopus delemar TaxID=936053 RepID=A0A9P6XP69_9FUNG|nr:hypothetical protein G6F50_017888 [Rhizopus delemar]